MQSLKPAFLKLEGIMSFSPESKYKVTRSSVNVPTQDMSLQQ